MSWPSAETLKGFAAVIDAASKSPLGIVALMVLALTVLALIWFRESPLKVRLALYGGMLLGVALYVAAISRTASPATTATAATAPAPPASVTVSYSGRVFDKKTLAAIHGAEVTLDILGAPPAFSDSNGQYVIAARRSSEPTRVRVTATNYRPYDQILLPESSGHFEDIGLDPTRNQTPPPKPSALTGVVVDEASKLPVEGAKVTLDIGDGPTVFRTDSAGEFHFYKVPPDAEGLLSVTAKGYKPFDRQLSARSRNEFRRILLDPAGH
jgi:hypothetical protein